VPAREAGGWGSVSSPEVVRGGDQAPLRAARGSAAALEAVGAAVELGLGEHGLDHALAFGVEPAAVLVFTALRPAELVARDVDAGRLSARKGVVVVRSGTGDASREVSMPEVRAR
jgi:hypothetical protein